MKGFCAGSAFLIPVLPFLGALGFVHPPGTLLLGVLAITGLYVAATERAKKGFFRREG